MKKYLFVLLCVCFGSAQAALVAVGPDAYGYSGQVIGSNLRDISSTGTYLSLADDQTSYAIAIGFDFNFYGTDRSAAFVSSNGVMGFSQYFYASSSSRTLPNADGIDGLIAGLWEDLNPSQSGTVQTQTLGVAGSREFVVGFYGIPHYPNSSPVTFEMILHEGSNDIEFQYGSIISDGGTHTIGIENDNGTDGLQVLRSSALDFSNSGYLISTSPVPIPAAVWLFGSGLIGLVGFARRNKV